jgi:enoyl-CoA hydratase
VVTDHGAVRVSTEGRIVVISINRPEARNAVNQEVALGIEAALDLLENDESLWVGVLTAAPPVFCAGADLKEISAGRRFGLRTERGGFAGIVARQRTKPLIAAVEGAALAGGTEICLACDTIVASSDGQLWNPRGKAQPRRLPGGALFRLPRKLPWNVAMEMAMTGEPITAERAYQFGLVTQLTAPGKAVEQGLALASAIAANPPIAVTGSSASDAGVCRETNRRDGRLSELAMAEAMASEDNKEGLAAFIEKRTRRLDGSVNHHR